MIAVWYEPLCGDLPDHPHPRRRRDFAAFGDAITSRMAAGSCEPTTAADVNDDGVVSSLDALMILQAAADLITL